MLCGLSGQPSHEEEPCFQPHLCPADPRSRVAAGRFFGISSGRKYLRFESLRPPATPEMRERLRAIAKARWADPVAGAQWRTALRSPTSRAKVSDAAKARWADPAYRERMIAEIRASRSDPDVRQRTGSASKERWADPAMREKIIVGMRATPKRRRNKDTTDS